MTRKLYYNDPTCAAFTARVLARQNTARGPAVQLDQTAFYATAGGQPHDTGTLDGIPVLDVWEDETGALWHLLARPLTGETVEGRIDWERRFDHMQQHSGQHLLSAACLQRFAAATVGFHLGAEASTIDLDIPQMHWEAACVIEDDVNRAIWENCPVTTRWVAREDLPGLELRKVPDIAGPFRIVEMAGYDLNACGGTHVARTGDIGLLKITGLERYKGGVRVTFLCGGRALRDYRRSLRLLQALSAALTVGQEELPAAVARLQTEHKETRRALTKAETALHALEADRLWEAAPAEGGLKRIVAHWPDRTFEEARAVASRLRERPQTLILLAVTEGEAVRLVCARSEDRPDIDASALLRQAAAALGGRGGGSPSLAQGGAPGNAPEAILDALKDALHWQPTETKHP